jgi:hypothetical protein
MCDGQLPAGSSPIHWKNDDDTQMYGNLSKFYLYYKNIKRCFSEAKESFFRKKDKDLFT